MPDAVVRVKGHRYWISVVFFLLAAAPGCWMPALSNVLEARGLSGWVAPAFMAPCVAGSLSPLIFGAQVDQRFQAQHVLGAILIGGAGFLYLAFYAVEEGWGGGWFFFFFAINALISAPAWSLLTTIALATLKDPARRFGNYRLWGTVGWMVAGFAVSWWSLDLSPRTGQMAAFIRLVAGGLCFCLPETRPEGRPAKSWAEALGLGAFQLMRDRNLRCFFVATFLFSMPLAAFYLHTPVHLKVLGLQQISATMALAQVVEAVAMVFLGVVVIRVRVKVLLGLAMIAGVLRFLLCAGDMVVALVPGIMLHGICWTFFFEAGRVFLDRRVGSGMRAQAQALYAMSTTGAAGLAGILMVQALYSNLVQGAEGWGLYWLTLSGISGLALIVFYRGFSSSET